MFVQGGILNGALGDEGYGDAEGNYFDVIAYRGGIVGSRDGWIRDEKARGGVITQVPGGFFHGIMAARFGSASPYAYELPPVWLLVIDGIDTGTDEFLSFMNYQGVAEEAENQRQDIVDIIDKAPGVIVSTTKWLAIAGVAAVALVVLSYVPHPSRRT